MNLPDIPDEPLEYRPRNKSFPQIPPEMIASIALGLEDELIIAARHGVSVEEYGQLQALPHFQRAVEAKRAEMVKDGVTFRVKASWMAEELLEKVYLMANNDHASFNQAHEALKTMMKAAGLEAKEDKTANQGPTFQISIDLGGTTLSLSNQPSPVQVKQVQAIDVDAKEVGE